MRHLNTGIRTQSISNSREIVDYLKTFNPKDPNCMLGGSLTGTYYINEYNIMNCQINFEGQIFNSVEEHKAYMNQTKIISIW